MKKTLKAYKCRNGWKVEVIEGYFARDLCEVLDWIRYSGLKVKKEFCAKNKGKYIIVYAD